MIQRLNCYVKNKGNNSQNLEDKLENKSGFLQLISIKKHIRLEENINYILLHNKSYMCNTS